MMKNIPCKKALIVVGLVAGSFGFSSEAGELESAPAVAAPEPASDFWNRDELTGDWGGLRPDLSTLGIDFDLRLSQYYQGVASGGASRDSEYGGTMDYRLNVDAGKLFGAKGLSFNMHARTRAGYDINADAGALVLPNAGMMMPAPGGYHDTDITGLTGTYMFDLCETHLGSVTVGQLDVIDLLTGFFPNIGYGQEGFWNVNSLASNMPFFGAVQGLSLYGGMAVTVNKQHGIPQSGVIVAATEGSSTTWPTVSDAFDDYYLAAFHRFIWEVDDKMGFFMVYASGSTKDQASNDPKDFIDIPGQGFESTKTKEPWNVALYLYQDICADPHNPDRKANILIGATVGPDNPQFAQWNLFANIEAFGLISSRPKDRTGASVWWNGLSDNFTDLVEDGTGEKLQDPWGLEFYYNFEVTPWAHVSADLQIAQNQAEDDDVAIIPGVRMVLDF